MRTEVVNKYGIMENSVLTVSVIEARDLKPMDFDGVSDPYVILECAGQTCQTKYHKSTLNPIWEESFTFDIFKGDEILKVLVMDKDAIKSDDFEGQCFIPLNSLKN
mgnify:CR=1 FL=1